MDIRSSRVTTLAYRMLSVRLLNLYLSSQRLWSR
nr:MAG TPA: hypothetical protein [Bacteriophage sp.]